MNTIHVIELDQPVYAKVFTGKAVRILYIVTGPDPQRTDFANEVMTHSPGLSLLTDTGNVAYLADKSDMGVPPANMEPFRT